METDKKPLISILMAVYEPRMDWLREQLESLNSQTYPNLRLYIRDDCSKNVLFEEIKELADECIIAFPCAIMRNEKNLGSNRTFERLTKEAEGEYFAYCDQDDIWLPEKLTALENLIEQVNGTMAYSDMSVIDANGETVATSLKDIRVRINYVSGEGLKQTYFFRNCTAGCCMLIKAELAKEAVPFPMKTVHDQWLAIVAAGNGRISFCSLPLVEYRQYGGNQTGVLAGVKDKESYRRLRLEPLKERLEHYEDVFGNDSDIKAFVQARLSGKVFEILKWRRLSPTEAKFEIAMKFMPEIVFEKVLRQIR